MAIVGVVTNTGLAEAVKVSSNQGWSIFPTRFGVSANAGDMRPTRTDANTMWYQAAISEQTVVSENTIQFVCTIPPQVIATDEYIREIYLFGENSEDQTEFLLAVGQPTETITYFKDGSITLRMHITLANVQASQVFEFKYTGHRSIEEHNTDETAHREIFGRLTDQIKALGETILIENQLASGGAVYIDRDTAMAKVDEGRFYYKGELITVPPGEFPIELSGQASIGVWIGADADGNQTVEWGTRYRGTGSSFHEVHQVEDGYLKTMARGEMAPEPVDTSVIRYDREANGSYIVHGLNVSVPEAGDSHYRVMVAEGKAHIEGVEVEKPAFSSLTYPFDPDTQLILSERHVFQPDEKGEMAVMVDNQPMSHDEPVKVTHLKAATLGIERAQSAGTQDLIIPGLTKVKAVTYGSSTFKEGRDFRVQGPYIDWGLAGAEPPTGALYTAEVEYLHEVTVSPEEVSTSGFTFSGAIPNTTLQVQYHAMLPRKDLIVLVIDGTISRIKGRGDTHGIKAPKAPEGTLALAELTHHWTPGIAPGVENTGVLAVRASELTEMQQQIASLFDMMAEERIARAASSDDPRAKRGIFIDPFIDDSMRDGGAVQTALIDPENEILTLAFDVHTMDTLRMSEDDAPEELAMLPYNLRAILEQTASTGHMLVNPYAAFDPIPPDMTLKPAIDNWTITGTTRNTISRTIRRSRTVRTSWRSGRTGRSTSSSTSSTTRTSVRESQLPNLRGIRVSFEIKGFFPGEQLEQLLFGGRDVTATIGDYGAPVVGNKLLTGDNSLLDLRPMFSGASDAVQNWDRNAQLSSGTQPTEVNVWEVSSGRVRCSANSSSLVSLVSRDTFDNFDVTVRYRGENDNDWIGVVLAAVKVGNKVHTLTAMHATRTSSTQRWMIAQNYRQSDQRILDTSKASQVPYTQSSWSRIPDGVTVRVRRRGDTIEVWSSEFNSRTIKDSTRYVIDLASDPQLAVFRAPGAWGFCAHSNRSNFEVVSHTNNGNLS